ncbi:hypothetical protein TH0630_07560 [Helicobacter pylori]
MGIDNKIELTRASGNFKKRYQEIRGGAMVSKPPPYPFKLYHKNKVLKNNIKAKQECFA